jgi:hypothetical protein
VVVERSSETFHAYWKKENSNVSVFANNVRSFSGCSAAIIAEYLVLRQLKGGSKMFWLMD